MSRLRRAAALAAVLALVLVVGVIIAFQFGLLPWPAVAVEDPGDWGSVTAERSEVLTTLRVENPYPFRLQAGYALDIDYAVTMNGVAMGEGRRNYLAIPQGTSRVVQSTFLDNDRLDEWWRAYVAAGETLRLTVDGSAAFQTPLGTVTYDLPGVERVRFENRRPIADSVAGALNRLEGRYVSEQQLRVGGLRGNFTVGVVVEETRVRWTQTHGNGTALRVALRVHNPSEVVPLVLDADALGVRFAANGVVLAEKNATAPVFADVTQREVLSPGETRTVVVRVPIKEAHIDDWFVRHVRRGERSRLQVTVDLAVRPPGGSETLRFPPDGVQYRCSMRTGLLVDGQEARSTCGGNDAAGGAVVGNRVTPGATVPA